MDVLGPVRAFDRLQRRHASLAIPIAVIRTFGEQGAGNAAALMAYFAFFSLFPLLLVFVSILGFVLQGDPSAQRSIVHSALGQLFPLIGQDAGRLGGSAVGVGLGLAAALLSGLGVTLAAQQAVQTVYMIPRRLRPNFLSSRWRGLKLLVAAGLLQIVSTVAAGAVSGGLGGPGLVVAGLAVSLVINVLLFFVVFRELVPGVVPTRELWLGIAIAAVAWEVLQSLGGLYVGHVVKGADKTYGSFATVIGLLAWLYLGARIVVYAAEINVTVNARLWPRSLFEPREPADRRVRAALAKVEERDDRESVTVAFHPPGDADELLWRPEYALPPDAAPLEEAIAALRAQLEAPGLGDDARRDAADEIERLLARLREDATAR
jgi:membrane protein